MVDRSSVLRRTLVGEPGFPCKQFWLGNDGCIWWDMNYLHSDLKRQKVTQLKRGRWLDAMTKAVAISTLPPAGACLHQMVVDAPSHILAANICTTLALLAVLAYYVDSVRSFSGFEVPSQVLRRMTQTACCSTVPLNGQWELDVLGSVLKIYGDSRVCGWHQVCTSGIGHMTSLKVIEHCWDSLHADGILGGPFQDESHTLPDIVIFICSFEKCRRSQGRNLSGRLRVFGERCRQHVFEWLASCFNQYVKTTYGETNPSVHLPPPALKSSGCKRKYTEIDAEAAWALIEKAAKAHANLEQALALNDDEDAFGCHTSQGSVWLNKLLQMYYAKSMLLWRVEDVHHYNFVADPGHHSYRECLVSLAYSWEMNGGTFPPWQHLLPGTRMTLDDAAMDSRIKQLAAEHKLQRVASFRQLQGISNQVSLLSGGSRSIADFVVPPHANVRPTEAHESRAVVHGLAQDTACLVDRESKTSRPVLPPGFDIALLLVLMLDQGSIGTAGCAFAIFQMGKLIFPKFDKIHRLVRDLKNAEKHVLDAVFMVTKMWSAYLYGMNNRPFNSGANATLKSRLLELFEITEDTSSPCFRKYLHKIAKEWDMPCDSQEEEELIWNKMVSLRSFTNKMSQPKTSNWFAWNKAAHDQIPEFWAAKCIFESQLDDIDPDDVGDAFNATQNPSAHLLKLLKAGGGLRLAYKLMGSSMHSNVKILYVAEHACWDRYTEQVEGVKTPAEGFLYSLRLANKGWQSSDHVWKSAQETLCDSANLDFMEVPMGESEQATKALLLTIHIMMYRLWSLTKHDVPPECYAPVCSSDQATAQAASMGMKADHGGLLLLEQARHRFSAALALWKDMAPIVRSKAVRLLFEFFCRDLYDHTSRSGRHLLKGMLWTMPDNKVCEDVHHKIRLDSRGNSNKKLNRNRCQYLTITSEVFERRGVEHKAKVTKAQFVRDFKKLKYKSMASKYRPKQHRLPEEWSKIMDTNKTWLTLSEETTNKAAAAWAWLRTYVAQREAGVDTHVDSARWSRFMPKAVVVLRGDDAWVSFGHQTWAFLAWPLRRSVIDGCAHYHFVIPGAVTWHHVTNPEDWLIAPFVACRSEAGIGFKQTAEAVSLAKHCLLTSCNKLSFEDLVMCAAFYTDEQVSESSSVDALCDILGRHFGPDDPGTPEKIKELYFQREGDPPVLEGPLVEAVYDDLDPDDKTEFPEVGEAIKKRRLKMRRVESKLKRTRVLAGMDARPKKRARTGAKAKAAPVPKAGPVVPPVAIVLAPPEPPQPPPPAAPHDGGNAAGHHAGPVLPDLVFTTIMCERCGQPAGQHKYHQSPGMRDGPSWIVRVKDPGTGKWGVRLPYKQVLRAIDGRNEAWAQNWVRDHKTCCPN